MNACGSPSCRQHPDFRPHACKFRLSEFLNFPGRRPRPPRRHRPQSDCPDFEKSCRQTAGCPMWLPRPKRSLHRQSTCPHSAQAARLNAWQRWIFRSRWRLKSPQIARPPRLNRCRLAPEFLRLRYLPRPGAKIYVLPFRLL